MNPLVNIDATRTGFAGFLILAQMYVRNTPAMQNSLKEHNVNLRLLLNAPDFPNPVLIYFHDHKIELISCSPEVSKIKSKWDARLTAPAEVFLEYFLGNMGIIRPLLLLKIKVDSLFSMLKLLKIIWFIKINIGFFQNNRTLARAVFWKMYHTK